jgi:uncharacterized protein
MPHYATKRFNYWGQLGLLTAFCGAGLVLGGLLSFIPLMGKVNIFDTKGSTSDIMNKILVPENASAIRWMQLISTLFLFFIPPVVYAWLCHRKAWLHLGLQQPISIKQVAMVLLIIVACSPAVAFFQDITEMLPWSKATLAKFKQAEADYYKQVMVIARMDNFTDYLLSIFMVALLPAVFEEVLFRGALQNLLSRWFKNPVAAIIVTAIIFSAIHGSYLGFLSRFVLGFVLGWIFYRTSSLWLSIVAHFFNNALAVTALYMSTKPGEKMDPSKMDENFPLYLGVLSIVVVVGLFVFFDKISKQRIDRPGEEVRIPGYDFDKNPFANDIAAGDNKFQNLN